jgi:hypothetical protein
MKHLKLFEAFSTTPLTEDQISWLDKCVKGSWKLNPQTGLVDVDGSFDCRKQGLTDFKGVKFGKVKWDFYCHDNELTSLVGAPQTVGGGFWCNGNQLTSLVGAPHSVEGGFLCEDNELTTLEGAPQTVGDIFYFIKSGGSLLNWAKGWSKKGDAEFMKTLISKLIEINSTGSGADKRKLTSMLLSLAGQNELLEYLLSLPTSDKFELYGKIKANMPDIWNKFKDELDPEGATSDLLDLGF